MSAHYEEIIEGEIFLRHPPGGRHEAILELLRGRLADTLSRLPAVRLAEVRSIVQLTPGSLVRPDLSLLTAANERLLLAVEVIDPNDHRVDTVEKKELYETRNVPRLWMVDPRYDNVEVYQCSPHGLRLDRILAGRDMLTEALLPGFSLRIAELFAGQ